MGLQYMCAGERESRVSIAAFFILSRTSIVDGGECLVGIDGQQVASTNPGIREVCTKASVKDGNNSVVSDACVWV